MAHAVQGIVASDPCLFGLKGSAVIILQGFNQNTGCMALSLLVSRIFSPPPTQSHAGLWSPLEISLSGGSWNL